MASVKDSDYKCTLDTETLKKAKKELGENPDTRLLEVKSFRERLEKVPGLTPRTDVNFLLPFLRARKFDQERAFELIKHHYQQQKDKHEHYDDIKPSVVRLVIDSNIMEVLRHRDNDRCRVVVVRPGLWDPDRCPITDTFKLLFLILSKLAQEEETQVHGIHMIDLLDTVTWKQGAHFTPGMAKTLASTLQDMVPLRLKRYDIVHEPVFFDIMFPILKNFLTEKLVDRLHLNKSDYKSLHASMNPDHLPTDLGGKMEPFSYNKEWMPQLLASEKDFEYSNKFGFVTMGLENSKRENNKPDAGLQGLGGTFKKLDI